MSKKNFVVVGIGEILWDLLPDCKQLGGAPTNFAYITTLLGDIGIAASRIGDDDLGREACRMIDKLSVRAASLQVDSTHPTGTVRVQVDSSGQPKFEIAESVAWDFLAWSSEWRRIASEADAVCFGSLAQRSPASRRTIREFLNSVRPDATRIFDVNLRQSYFSAEVVSESMQLAEIVKLNEEELPRVMGLLGLESRDEETSAKELLRRFNLKLVCVTRGSKGSLLVSDAGAHPHPGYRVTVKDTVGAGDAFTAGLVHQYLRGASLPAMNDMANRVGSWVASQPGGTPAPDVKLLRENLAGSG